MLNKQEKLSNVVIENMITEIDYNFRWNFQDVLKEMKLHTHKCQYLCYQNKEKLQEAEICSRNCFLPLLNSKKNISIIMENNKENFEKCKLNAEGTFAKDQGGYRRQVYKCLEKYTQDLDQSKDEIEYIYKGYMKNFEILLGPDVKGEEKKI